MLSALYRNTEGFPDTFMQAASCRHVARPAPLPVTVSPAANPAWMTTRTWHPSDSHCDWDDRHDEVDDISVIVHGPAAATPAPVIAVIVRLISSANVVVVEDGWMSMP